MMFRWEPEMVRFMRDASEYGDYNQKLAEMLLPQLSADSHICDAGCGLGYLSLALAPYVKSVTAVDQNENALRVLRENCKKRGVGNITAVCSDITALPEASTFDSMAFCFFGNIAQILKIAAQRCRGSVFVITKNYTEHRFSVGKHPGGQESYLNAIGCLDSLGVPYAGQTAELEFGQPFRTFEDARRFYTLYSRDDDPSLITDEFLHSKLKDIGKPDFPFYLPHQRKIGLLRFAAEDIPGSLKENTRHE